MNIHVTKYDYEIFKILQNFYFASRFIHVHSLYKRSFWKLFKAFFPQPFFALCKFSVNFLLATGAGLLLSVKVSISIVFF